MSKHCGACSLPIGELQTKRLWSYKLNDYGVTNSVDPELQTKQSLSYKLNFYPYIAMIYSYLEPVIYSADFALLPRWNLGNFPLPPESSTGVPTTYFI
ncbi:Uncharacterised protein [Chlamydia trachomatis]|nr:Uncharacterised protein [Chlamydia trachomatis]